MAVQQWVAVVFVHIPQHVVIGLHATLASTGIGNGVEGREDLACVYGGSSRVLPAVLGTRARGGNVAVAVTLCHAGGNEGVEGQCGLDHELHG